MRLEAFRLDDARDRGPGPVETPLLQELSSDPPRRQRRLVHIPSGRFARAEEMANVALFLASDEAWYVNWSTFLVHGGDHGGAGYA